MAKFEEEKVINALHPEKAEVGKKYWCSDSLLGLKHSVKNNSHGWVYVITEIDASGIHIFKSGQISWEFLYPYKEPKEQRMTNRQFCEWNDKGNGQWKRKDTPRCHIDYSYSEELDNEEVDKDIIIRSWDSDEWVEPTVDIYERDCKHLSQDEFDYIADRDDC